MEIDAQKIIADTVKVFTNSKVQQDKFSKIKDFIYEPEYNKIHRSFLTETNILIDTELFKQEIKQYNNYFEQWGKHHSELPRYGVALVNLDGSLKTNDPINGSLYEYNALNSNYSIIESDCLIPTEIMNISSLEPLSVFNGHWCRSNVLKWDNGAEFKPHIDNILPAPWIRLWASMSSDIEIRYYDDTINQMKTIDNIQLGRVYVIDTSKVHDAKSISDDTYQLFLAILPSGSPILQTLL